MPAEFIDSTQALIDFLDRLPDCKGQPPSLYVDLEGNNLSRHGTLSLITILVQPQEKIYLIDVTSLGQKAFETESTKGLTLKGLFEADDICKVFFDIRRDSDALYSLHQVHVKNVEDLQLMEFASRTAQKRYLNGLAKCIERDSSLSYSQNLEWQKVKEQGRKLFQPERGGSYAVFDERPLSAEVMDYCVQDVVHMPHLRERYLNRLCDEWYVKILREGEERIRLSQSPSFDGQGRHMAIGPVGWQSWRPAVHKRGKQTLFQSTRTKAGPSLAHVAPRASMPYDSEDLSRLLGSLDFREVGTIDLMIEFDDPY